jgi:hypothetical protein
MGEKFGCIGTIDAVNEQNPTQNHKDGADHPSGQFDTDENPDHSDSHVEWSFCTRTVVDRFEIEYPVSHAENGKKYQNTIEYSKEHVFGFIYKKNKDIGDNNVYAPMILGSGRSQHRRIGVEKDQAYGQYIEYYFFNFI